MKKPRIIKRIQIDRTTNKSKGIDLNKLIKDTLIKIKQGKYSRSILVKRTNQKNVFLIKFSTGKAFSPLTLRKMRDYLKKSNLQVLDCSIQTTLNTKGSGEKSLVLFRVKVKSSKLDMGKKKP